MWWVLGTLAVAAAAVFSGKRSEEETKKDNFKADDNFSSAKTNYYRADMEDREPSEMDDEMRDWQRQMNDELSNDNEYDYDADDYARDDDSTDDYNRM